MWIADAEYRRIAERMPIPTVDAILTFEGRFLLLKRNNPPVKGEWWLPGGRVRKGEALEAAVTREVKEETGLTGRILRFSAGRVVSTNRPPSFSDSLT